MMTPLAGRSGHNSIWIYSIDGNSGLLELVGESKSVRKNDSPRHVLPHPNGRYLYVVRVVDLSITFDRLTRILIPGDRA
jgi:6-phosphogluconolactonase (cycloisomerase 2 family)